MVGVLGAKAIVAELDALEDADVPKAFIATTVYVYVPAVGSVTTIGLDEPVAVALDEDVTL
jgi:hypothetical protein